LQRYLSEEAKAAVQDLLPASAGGELSTMCPWADTVRFRYHWASPLHYANTPNVCNFNNSRQFLLPLSISPTSVMVVFRREAQV
jgi:hypothetical protein